MLLNPPDFNFCGEQNYVQAHFFCKKWKRERFPVPVPTALWLIFLNCLILFLQICLTSFLFYHVFRFVFIFIRGVFLHINAMKQQQVFKNFQKLCKYLHDILVIS